MKSADVSIMFGVSITRSSITLPPESGNMTRKGCLSTPKYRAPKILSFY